MHEFDTYGVRISTVAPEAPRADGQGDLSTRPSSTTGLDQSGGRFSYTFARDSGTVSYLRHLDLPNDQYLVSRMSRSTHTHAVIGENITSHENKPFLILS